MRNTWLSLGSVFALALFAAVAGPAQAHHFVYLAQDPTKQDLDIPQTENWGSWNWAIGTGGDGVIEYSVDSVLSADFAAAVSDWQAKVPELPLVPVSDTTDLLVLDANCPGAPVQVLGCVDPFYLWDGLRGVNWVRVFVMYINAVPQGGQPPYAPGARQATIAHELGHVFSLHEQYLDTNPVQCNDDIVSTMDAATVSGGLIVHCDLLTGPVEDPDIVRVDEFWGNGDFGNFNGCCVGTHPSDLTFTWEDGAWAEYYDDLFFYWYPSGGTGWSLTATRLHVLDIGSHSLIPEVPMRIQSEEIPSVGPGWHVACGYPFNLRYNKYGAWQCSTQVFQW